MSTRDSLKKDENISCERFGVELGLLWRKYAPEMRFMQFIVNFQSWMDSNCFYMEDYDAIQKMELFGKLLKYGKGL